MIDLYSTFFQLCEYGLCIYERLGYRRKVVQKPLSSERDKIIDLVRQDLEHKINQLSKRERQLYEPFMRWSDETIIRYVSKKEETKCG
jgi:hypothetical protein